MTFAEIGRALGITEYHAKWLCYSALRKLQRECKRRGIDVADIIGKPRSMMARLEDCS